MNRRIRVSLELAMAASLAVLPVNAQQPGGNPAGNNPGSTPSNPTTTTPRPGTSPFPGQQDQQNRFPDMQRPIFLSGKVVLDDGTPPPEPVNIERVCNGRVRLEGYTDTKGRFSFQLGQNSGVLQDASMSNDDSFGVGSPQLGNPRSSNAGGFGGMGTGRGVSERDLMGCEIRAALPGFRSDIVNLSGRRMFDNPDVGTIVLHRIANVEGTTISMVAMQAPKDAKKSMDKARDLIKKNKTVEAQKELEKAIQLYPKYSTAHYELGRLMEAQNKPEEALKSYEQALAADPKYINPYRQIAGMYFKDQKWQEVADTTSRIVKLDPVSYPDAYFYDSVANYYLKKYDAAETSAREVLKLDPNHRMPMASNVLAAILIEKQDYPGAAEQLKDFVKYAKPERDQANIDRAKKQLEQLEKAITANAK